MVITFFLLLTTVLPRAGEHSVRCDSAGLLPHYPSCGPKVGPLRPWLQEGLGRHSLISNRNEERAHRLPRTSFSKDGLTNHRVGLALFEEGSSVFLLCRVSDLGARAHPFLSGLPCYTGCCL